MVTQKGGECGAFWRWSVAGGVMDVRVCGFEWLREARWWIEGRLARVCTSAVVRDRSRRELSGKL
jgi:hypothetical protein